MRLSSCRSHILLEAEMNKLLPERKGTTDIYAIGVAGWSDQNVFIKELNGGLASLNKTLEAWIGVQSGSSIIATRLKPCRWPAARILPLQCMPWPGS